MKNRPEEIFTIADNNCGPRAIVQSLLLKGFVNPHERKFVCQFLRAIVARHKESKFPYVEPQFGNRYLSRDECVEKELVGRSDPRPPYDTINDNIERLPLNQKKELEQQVEIFIDKYERLELTPANWDLLVSTLMPSAETRGCRPTHDHIIYLLAAYFRFDMYQELFETKLEHQFVKAFNDEHLSVMQFEEGFDDFRNNTFILDKPIDVRYAVCYLATKSIGLIVLSNGSVSANSSLFFNQELQPKFSLTLLGNGLHFSAQCPSFGFPANASILIASIHILILNGLIAAIGIATVAIAFTVINAATLGTAGLIVASFGVVATLYGGIGLSKNLFPTVNDGLNYRNGANAN